MMLFNFSSTLYSLVDYRLKVPCKSKYFSAKLKHFGILRALSGILLQWLRTFNLFILSCILLLCPYEIIITVACYRIVVNMRGYPVYYGIQVSFLKLYFK